MSLLTAFIVSVITHSCVFSAVPCHIVRHTLTWWYTEPAFCISDFKSYYKTILLETNVDNSYFVKWRSIVFRAKSVKCIEYSRFNTRVGAYCAIWVRLATCDCIAFYGCCFKVFMWHLWYVCDIGNILVYTLLMYWRMLIAICALCVCLCIEYLFFVMQLVMVLYWEWWYFLIWCRKQLLEGSMLSIWYYPCSHIESRNRFVCALIFIYSLMSWKSQGCTLGSWLGCNRVQIGKCTTFSKLSMRISGLRSCSGLPDASTIV